MKKFVIDRFEGNFAVLEDETCKTFNVKKTLLQNAAEGDVVLYENGEYHTDKEETERRKRDIEEKMKKLFKK